MHVTTGSRLHFGLFSLPGTGQLNRQFGGVGLMIDRPGFEVRVQRAEVWSAVGPLAERALGFAKQWAAATEVAQAFRIHIDRAAPEHQGLGTGTQLGLAVGHALAAAVGQPMKADDLARILGRGFRSALGIHGFVQGGFLVEAGKTAETAISPLVVRADFPTSWQVVLVLPHDSPGLHGQLECVAFARLAEQPSSMETDVLCRLTLLGMLPALAEQDLPAFGEALYEFNRRVGEMFRAIQGGIYAHPRTEELVKFFRQQGVRGAGQSSWGPAVFAIVEEERGEQLVRESRERFVFAEDEVMVTTARNRGAE